METKGKELSVNQFDILFEKLEEAKSEQQISSSELEQIKETQGVIELFKEFQESITEMNYSTYTRS